MLIHRLRVYPLTSSHQSIQVLLCKTESCKEDLCGPPGSDILFPLFRCILLCWALDCDLKNYSNPFPFLLALVGVSVSTENILVP